MEAISTFDIFKIGVGPSSSHTMGPWRAAQRFLDRCGELGLFARIAEIRVDLYGSLAKTGHGHGTDVAVILGLAGEDPVTCDTAGIHDRVAAIRSVGQPWPPVAPTGNHWIVTPEHLTFGPVILATRYPLD